MKYPKQNARYKSKRMQYGIKTIDIPYGYREIWTSMTRREKITPSQIYDNGYNPSISYPLWMLFIYKRFWITFNSHCSLLFFDKANVAGTPRYSTIGLALLLSHFSLTQSSWPYAKKQWLLALAWAVFHVEKSLQIIERDDWGLSAFTQLLCALNFLRILWRSHT